MLFPVPWIESNSICNNYLTQYISIVISYPFLYCNLISIVLKICRFFLPFTISKFKTLLKQQIKIIHQWRCQHLIIFKTHSKLFPTFIHILHKKVHIILYSLIKNWISLNTKPYWCRPFIFIFKKPKIKYGLKYWDTQSTSLRYEVNNPPPPPPPTM